MKKRTGAKRKPSKKTNPPANKEVWVRVKKAPFCEVSNFGRIRSWKLRGYVVGRKNTAVILRQHTTRHGQKTANIFFNGKFGAVQVKSLVYDNFSGKYRHPNTIVINKDGDRSNIRFDNLILMREFTDLPDEKIVRLRKEYRKGAKRVQLAKKYGINLEVLSDILHGDKGRWAGGPIAKRVYKRKLTNKQIEQIRKRGRSGKETEAQIGKAFRIREQRVSRILNVRRRPGRKPAVKQR